MRVDPSQRFSNCPSFPGLSLLFCSLHALTGFSAVVLVKSTPVGHTTTVPDQDILVLLNTSRPAGTLSSLDSPVVAQLLRRTKGQGNNEDYGAQNVCNFESDEKVVCSGIVWKEELIVSHLKFAHVHHVVFMNLTVPAEAEGFGFSDLKLVFPQAKSLSFLSNISPGNNNSDSQLNTEMKSEAVKRLLSTFPAELKSSNESERWESVEELNLSGNSIQPEWIPRTLLQLFPNLRKLDLSHNEISSLEMLHQLDLNRLESVDLSGW